MGLIASRYCARANSAPSSHALYRFTSTRTSPAAVRSTHSSCASRSDTSRSGAGHDSVSSGNGAVACAVSSFLWSAALQSASNLRFSGVARSEGGGREALYTPTQRSDGARQDRRLSRTKDLERRTGTARHGTQPALQRISSRSRRGRGMPSKQCSRAPMRA